MPILRTTVGNLIANQALPDELKDYSRVLDKKNLNKLLGDVATKYPDQYEKIAGQLMRLGVHAGQSSGGYSFGVDHVKMLKSAKDARVRLRGQIEQILDNPQLSDEEKDAEILKTTSELAKHSSDDVYKEALESGNPLANHVLSGAKGNKSQLSSILASDLLYVDHRNRAIPFPVLNSYSKGLSPAEYWAGAYGARKGIIDLKAGTRDAGYLSKILAQASHRLLVTDTDGEIPYDTLRGFAVATDDSDNEGALLAQDIGGYKRNTILSPKHLADLRKQGIERILVRSPIVGGPEDGGVYARDVGIREKNHLLPVGSNPGMTAAHALSEPISQSVISSKHSGGVVGAAASRMSAGFNYIEQLVNIPKTFQGGATHAAVDGQVDRTEDAPAGGKYVYVGSERHHVPQGAQVTVKRGDTVEAGDVLSDGAPNPSVIVQHKGIGEGRRYFVKAFGDAIRNTGMPAHRRNVELLARGLINHVRMTEETEDRAPGDIVSYQELEHTYQPRDGHKVLKPKDSVGKYLEKPYLHYTIGTKVKPSMLKDFTDFGVEGLDVHDKAPPFEPEMIRGSSNLSVDQDWQTAMYGSGLKGSLLHNVHRGASSNPLGTSFVPSLARSVDFGLEGKIRAPKDPPISRILQ